MSTSPPPAHTPARTESRTGSHTASRTVAIIVSAVGGLVLLGMGASSAIAVVAGSTGGFSAPNASGSGGSHSVAVDGVTSIEVESNASDFELRFDDVPDARLDIVGETRYHWDIAVDDDELVVTSGQPFWDFCLGWCSAGPARVTLTLPEELNTGNLDAELEVAAGSLRADGDFRSLDLDMSAGAAVVEGSARSLSLGLSAGRVDVQLDSVREAVFDLSAGRADVQLTGDAPRRTGIDVSAGNLDLALPDETYSVQSEVSAGNIDNLLRTDPGSSRTIEASVSAGSVVLKPGNP